MKNLVIPVLLFLSGCAVWEQAVENAPEIQTTGQTIVDVGAPITTINPEIGVCILVMGGLVIAVGKALGLFVKNKKK